MQRKVFIAINLDDKTKKFIQGKLLSWQDQLPLKWTNPDNLHLTVQFIGYIEDQQILEIVTRLNEKLQGADSFDINLDLIGWGPKPEKPKMLWLMGEKNTDLINLRRLVESAVANIDINEKEFRPHVTLGRVIRGQKRNLPQISQRTNILVPVLSVDVMESVVEKGRRKYYILESVELI